MEIDIMHLSLKEHYLIFLDLDQDADEQEKLSQVTSLLKQMGSIKTTRLCYTLNHNKVLELEDVAKRIGQLLKPKDIVWFVTPNGMPVVVSPLTRDMHCNLRVGPE